MLMLIKVYVLFKSLSRQRIQQDGKKHRSVVMLP